jgi:hypothetical protein
MRVVTNTTVPIESQLHAALASADFFDAYEALLTDGRLSPTEIFPRSVGATPPGRPDSSSSR